MLGLRLQQLRKERRLTQQEVGQGIWASGSKVSRIESGMVGLGRRDVVRLLNFYGITDADEHDRYLSLVQLGDQPGWWHQDRDALPKGFELLNLESAARTIRCYEPAVVPELLQTDEYARAVLRLRYPYLPGDEIDRLLAVRLQRQQVLDRADPPYLWILVEESALRRPIGGDAVWRNQLDHLEDVIQAPNVSLQIVGDNACGSVRAVCGFLYLRFIDTQLPDVVCVAQPNSMLYLEERRDIECYLRIADLIAVEAARPGNTAAWLESLKSEANRMPS